MKKPVVTEHPAERPIVLAIVSKSLTKELGAVTGVGSILLGKERDGIWRLPGGGLQSKELSLFHETTDTDERNKILLKAIRREIREELDYTKIQDIHFFAKIPGKGMRSGKPLTAYVYILHPEGEVSTPTSSTEFVEIRWIDDPDILTCQKKGEHISPLTCKTLRVLRTQGMH